MKNVGNSSRGRGQGVMNIIRAPYRAHCAVIFATAQLSCLPCDDMHSAVFVIANLSICPQLLKLFIRNHLKAFIEFQLSLAGFHVKLSLSNSRGFCCVLMSLCTITVCMSFCVFHCKCYWGNHKCQFGLSDPWNNFYCTCMFFFDFV